MPCCDQMLHAQDMRVDVHANLQSMPVVCISLLTALLRLQQKPAAPDTNQPPLYKLIDGPLYNKNQAPASHPGLHPALHPPAIPPLAEARALPLKRSHERMTESPRAATSSGDASPPSPNAGSGLPVRAAQLTVEFLEQGGYFDMPITVSRGSQCADVWQCGASMCLPCICSALHCLRPACRTSAAGAFCTPQPRIVLLLSLTLSTCPMQEAALKLQIAQTTVKKVCRKLRVARWPFRKRKSIETLNMLCDKIMEFVDALHDRDRTEFMIALHKDCATMLEVLAEYCKDKERVSAQGQGSCSLRGRYDLFAVRGRLV